MRKIKRKNNSGLSFVKAEATGNDFVIVDLRDKKNQRLWQGLQKMRGTKNWVASICDRHFGVGADGVVLLKAPKKKVNSLAWTFINADGSEAEMCGNASRCVGLYETVIRKKKGPHRLETLAGVVILEVSDSRIWVRSRLPSVEILEKHFSVKGKNKTWSGTYINSGVPHFVVEVDSLSEREMLATEARAIKKSSEFAKAGTNVTFVSRQKDQFYMMTHERGVEAFTLSCGTGAVAAALYLADKHGHHRGSRLELPGGSIEVNLGEQIELVGPAHLVFRGQYAV